MRAVEDARSNVLFTDQDRDTSKVDAGQIAITLMIRNISEQACLLLRESKLL